MNKNKAITIIISLIIVLGIIITLTVGFNVDIMTKKHSQILLNIGKEYNIDEIRNITNEVFEGKEVKLNKAEVFDEQVLISSEEITEEQKNTLVQKVNEKYQTEIKQEDVKIDSVPKGNLKNYIVPHIMEFIWTMLIIIVYNTARYNKLGTLRVLVQTILGVIITELLVFSIIAIARIPLGSNLVSIMYISYILSVLGLGIMNEKQLKIKEEEEIKKEN